MFLDNCLFVLNVRVFYYSLVLFIIWPNYIIYVNVSQETPSNVKRLGPQPSGLHELKQG